MLLAINKISTKSCDNPVFARVKNPILPLALQISGKLFLPFIYKFNINLLHLSMIFYTRQAGI